MSKRRCLVALSIDEDGYVTVVGAQPLHVKPGELKAWEGGDFVVIIHRKPAQPEVQDAQGQDAQPQSS